MMSRGSEVQRIQNQGLCSLEEGSDHTMTGNTDSTFVSNSDSTISYSCDLDKPCIYEIVPILKIIAMIKIWKHSEQHLALTLAAAMGRIVFL